MRIAYILLIVLFNSFAAKIAIAQERIMFFKVAIETDTSGNILVSEHIKIYAEGDIFKRGIFRNIPTSRMDKDGKYVDLAIENIEVLQDGNAATFKTSYKSSVLEIRVGEAEVLLTKGAHEYVINYKIQQQIGFFESYDELYWNVTGNGWAMNIDKVSCTFTAPPGALILQAECYTGEEGSTAKSCSFGANGSDKITFEATALKPYEGLTIAAGFTKGILTPPTPPTHFETHYGLYLSGIFLLLIIIYMAWSWLRYGRDPEKPVVIPTFSPPGNMSPAHLAMAYKGIYSKELFSISIINLAVKGFLKIEDNSSKTLLVFNNSEYKLTKLLPPAGARVAAEENVILKNLFDSSGKSIEATGAYNIKFATAFTAYQNQFKEDEATITGQKNRRFLWIPVLLLISFWITVAFYDGTEAFFNIFFLGTLVVVPFFLAIPLIILSSLFRKNTNVKYIYLGILLSFSVLFLGIIFMDNTDFSFNTKVISLFSITLLLLFVAYRYLIQRPSVQRVKTLAEIEGFKMYLGAAEESQLQHLNSPEMTPEIFENMLPYAIALGVEKIWGEKFQQLLARSGQEANTYRHSWYSGSNAFHINNLSQMNNSMGTALNSSSIKPSTSSSSGGGSWSSGSSGGGSSGGGGGGGGGGGW